MKTLLALLLMAGLATAGELHWVKAAVSTGIPSDGLYHEFKYTNLTGQTIFVTRIIAYVQGGSFGGGDLNGYIYRESDDAETGVYWTWHLMPGDNPFGTGPQGNQVPQNYGSDYFTLVPGDGLTLKAKGTGFGGLPSLAGFHFWYVTQ